MEVKFGHLPIYNSERQGKQGSSAIDPWFSFFVFHHPLRLGQRQIESFLRHGKNDSLDVEQGKGKESATCGSRLFNNDSSFSLPTRSEEEVLRQFKGLQHNCKE
ncbi:hypothetical protein QQP08_020653 [Theobroma cacao]|nr:hypothetical protein QQP08_020653 [Theobroma cacao]